jgi:hypothetical protein
VFRYLLIYFNHLKHKNRDRVKSGRERDNILRGGRNVSSLKVPGQCSLFLLVNVGWGEYEASESE